ncbi:MAG TPA: glycerophosphodiester phosphodiesterase family protein [Candidatus Binatia bacterium]
MLALAALAVLAGGCSDSDSLSAGIVRERIAALAPSANIGHRGTGHTRPGHPFPENSISSFLEAMRQGADGIELDVEITADGGLIVMHDDTLDRTTTCTGCVSAYTLDEVRACLLLDGDGQPTDEHPPTLAETYAALPPNALVNVELKVYGRDCLTPTTGAEALAQAAVTEVRALGVLDRSFFSSFDEHAAAAVKQIEPTAYSALLIDVASSLNPAEKIALALELGLDAIHPFFIIDQESTQSALAAGLQANFWTVNTPEAMNESIDKGSTAIITDEPAILVEVLAERRGAR